MSATVPVTVIIPVYRDAGDVRRCLESVARHAVGIRTPFTLLVVNDNSPEPEVRAVIDEFCSAQHAMPVEVLHNEINLGFVGTMNRGIRNARGDIVMLNADTIVTDGWLDQLAGVASGPDVATVTPLTNHGSICTLPESIIDAFALTSDEPHIDACADFVRSHSLRLTPEVITGVGFCMYTTRAALDRVELLDEATFGRGYGEEVDFCLRLTRMGLRHLVDDATFVFHRGGGSFGDEQKKRWSSSAAIIDDRYPYFRATNQRERNEDPLRIPFTALELALTERDETRPHVLHVLHSPPDNRGGTEKFVLALCEALDEDLDFCISYPVPNGIVVRTHWRVPGVTAVVQNEYLLPAGSRTVTEVNDPSMQAAFEMALDTFRFDAVHIHNLIGYSLAPLVALRDFPGPVICSVHDLFLACPNFSLLYNGAESCGVPTDRSVCASCLKTIAIHPVPGSPQIPDLDLEYLDAFRDLVRINLGAVDRWIFASRSAADTFLRVYEPDPDRMMLIEHGSVIPVGDHRFTPDERFVHAVPLRVAFVGLGWLKKGLRAANYAADALADSPIEIHHFGEMKEPGSTNLIAHGAYDNTGLPELLRGSGIQIALLPGPYAETFGLVMTEALAAGIPVIGTTYGALGERIRAHGTGWTVDPLDYDGIVDLIRRLDVNRDEVMRATRRVARVQLETVADTAHRYRALYTNRER